MLISKRTTERSTIVTIRWSDQSFLHPGYCRGGWIAKASGKFSASFCFITFYWIFPSTEDVASKNSARDDPTRTFNSLQKKHDSVSRIAYSKETALK
ncbi:hypothetical protein NPIL_671361 [Nephila pilipes]|uniref:Uncharacterized protein n=1 Tax=Nephila pilipes TaxID=299642 RepID=A0A8X6JMT8_NEPPI|nr:hypothetical protein NPIL_671361 [Nephila pilipes]